MHIIFTTIIIITIQVSTSPQTNKRLPVSLLPAVKAYNDFMGGADEKWPDDHVSSVQMAHRCARPQGFHFNFDVKDTSYDSGRCTIETGVLENMGVAVGILRLSWLEPEIWSRVSSLWRRPTDNNRTPILEQFRRRKNVSLVNYTDLCAYYML